MVRTETVDIFGGTGVKNVGEPAEGAPTLAVRGTVFFGGVSVRGPKARFGRGQAPTGATALHAPSHRTGGCGH